MLSLLLTIVPNGISVWAPPCSLFVWLSSSIHRRSMANPLGDVRQFLVRLGNCIAKNAATAMRAQLKFRSDTFCIAEQPKGSWMFKCPWWVSLSYGFYLQKTLTYQGLFGCVIEKGTHLLHNLPSDALIARKMTKANRQWMAKRIQQMKTKPKAVYIKN